MLRSITVLAGLLVLLLPCAVPRLDGQTRYARLFDSGDGLIPSVAVSLAQDSTGLLWIGTAGGLYRFDGVAMRRVAADSLRSWVSALSVSPEGTLAALDENHGAVYEIVRGSVRRVAGPDGTGLDNIITLAFDQTGGLWLAGRDRLLRRAASGAWTRIDREDRGAAPFRRLVPSPRGGVLVLTHAAVWEADPQTQPRELVRIDNPVDALSTADGRLYVATFDGRVVQVRRGQAEELVAYPNRAISLALRSQALWIAYDHHLAVLEPGRQPEVLGAADQILSGGPLLVDHEGSLWVGTAAGLVQLPEPDTRIWIERHGLPSRHTRYLARTGDTVWVNTWRGSAAVSSVEGTWKAWEVAEWSGISRMFVQPGGMLWLESRRPDPGVLQVHAGRVRRRFETLVSLYGFSVAPDHGIWVATNQGLLSASTERGMLRRVKGLPFGSDTVPVHALLIDRAGRVWVAHNTTVCRTRGLPTGSVIPPDWACDVIPGGHHLTAMAELPSGEIWVAVSRGGLWRYTGERWEPLPGARRLPALDMQGLVPARDSGLWIIGTGTVARVIEDRSAPDGWRELERITAWHGLHNDGDGDLLEEPDGTLWLATGGGVVRVPPGARRARPNPPRVVLGEALVDGINIPPEDAIRLPHHRNRLELRFAAISYRDPSLLRYEVRVSPQHPWERVQGEPAFRWVDLPSGRYRAEVRASLDGTTWTPEPARFEFRVLRPWYLMPWAIAIFALGVLAILTAIYRARVSFLLELERQRTRIAMDLHDEMGSGLGSIGILSSMLSSGRLEAGQNARVADEIAQTAGELGTALSGIVWSLTPRAGTVEELAGRLAEHGRRLFADGSTEFGTLFPDPWPDARLHPSVRRNALLIIMEALHNAARHSSASRVSLAITCGHSVWSIAVEDDGVGVDGAIHRDRQGLGLASMRRRAQEIGASLRWMRTRGGGTRVVLRFDPSVRRTRWSAWRGALGRGRR
jgi:signal transduction histidine kinase